MRKMTVGALAVAMAASLATSMQAAPKNVILMISDGWGYNAVQATNAWTGVANQAYQGSDFVHFAMSTYSANGMANGRMGYDPAQAWADGTYNQPYVKQYATDSASAITAMMTGVKNFDGQLNWSTSGQPLTPFSSMYKWAGRSVGSVSTVHWTHATPAGIGSHNSSRNNYDQLANEMIASGELDVIMGAGHPAYDDNGQPMAPTSTSYKRVGGQATWDNLVNGQTAYSLITDRAEFQNLATGNTPARVVGTFKAGTTSQQVRSGYSSLDTPGSVPFNQGVPTMAEMVLGALNVLDNNPSGFFVMMEGGAVDWANHANQPARLIEEQDDFNKAVDAIINWVNSSSNWNDTLLIVTGDHECGMITGPTDALNVVDNGAGVMPGVEYNSGSHTNSLIPLYAKGAGSELFAMFATGTDPVRGAFIDNTDIFRVMTASTGVVPEPGSMVVLATGLAGLAGLLRKR